MGQGTQELSRDIAGTRQDLAYDLQALEDRLSPHAIMERRKAAARGRMHRMRSRVMGTAEHAQRSAGQGTSQAASAVQDTAQSAVEQAEERYEGSPLGAGLVAFGAGMVISALLPPTEAEQRAARQVVDTAKEHGQPLAEEAKAVGREVGQDLKETAQESTQELRQSAQESAERVKSEGQSAQQHVKEEAQDRSGGTGSTPPSAPPPGGTAPGL